MTVEPPAKRQQLLTEHQKEKQRERSDSIPTMYNALDPSQECASQPSVPDRYTYTCIYSTGIHILCVASVQCRSD